MDIHIQCLCVDAAEPKKIASLWEAALGSLRSFDDDDDQVCSEPPKGSPEDGVTPLSYQLAWGFWRVRLHQIALESRIWYLDQTRNGGPIHRVVINIPGGCVDSVWNRSLYCPISL